MDARRVSADHGHPKGGAGRLHALEHALVGAATQEQHVHHRPGASAHGCDVAHVDHHRGVAGEPRIGTHELVPHAFGCEQHVRAVGGAQSRRVIAIAHLAGCAQPVGSLAAPEHLGGELDVLLELQLAPRRELERQAAQLPRLELHAALRASARALGHGG